MRTSYLNRVRGRFSKYFLLELLLTLLKKMISKKITLFFLGAVTVLVAAWKISASNSTPVNSAASNPSLKPVSETPASVKSADKQCVSEIPKPLKALTGKYRLAQKSDLVGAIRDFFSSEAAQEPFSCPLVKADFNEDGKQDYALLLVEPKALKSQFRLAIATADGKFKSVVIKNYDKPPKPVEGLTYTAMFFKPSGKFGPADRKYFPLAVGTPELTEFITKPAIELWRPFIANAPRSVKANPANYDIDHLAYCSEVFYFTGEKLQTTVVCD